MKNVLIIGGSTDIGVSIAEYLLKNSYNVIATYYSNPINSNKIEYLKCNILNEEDIETTIKYAISKYENNFILINMASISIDNDFLSKTKEEFMKVFEVNLVGPFLTSKIYSKYISNGMIINISSTDGINTYSKYSMDYSASKAGLINLSKSMSLATQNKVLCICPNWIDSGTTRSMDKNYLDSELKRIGQDRLITIDELNKCIYDVINGNTVSGDTFILDIKDGAIWMKKMP